MAALLALGEAHATSHDRRPSSICLTSEGLSGNQGPRNMRTKDTAHAQVEGGGVRLFVDASLMRWARADFRRKEPFFSTVVMGLSMWSCRNAGASLWLRVE